MLTKKLKFDNDVLFVIKAMRFENDGLLGIMTNGQLERKLYERTNKALKAMGGKWNRKAGGHVFTFDPRGQVDGLLQNGSLTIERDGFFDTPLNIVRRMIELVPPKGMVLEPSAGLGAIVDHLPIMKDLIICVEKNENRANVLREKGYAVNCCDFLDYTTVFRFGSIFMNPPFEEFQDIDHVRRAHKLLSIDGVLISVMSESPFFRTDQKSVAFRKWLDGHDGYSEELPEGSFKESGTGVRARLVVIGR